ncbi:RNA methyltransferase [Peptoniphilus harei]|uniref:TrmH family RNA methyltransferase n=1 Tax=Peptoniphilus harei TaxID=54005 RepID=UPI0028FE78EE|nr:RNA methyltransferase [Peptoniphilus harei]MDU1643208.1 RNA methyltransferase [Peptoniphilus harei]
MIITSKNNNTYKFLKGLLEKKHRQEHKLFMVEKPVVIEEAEGIEIHYLALSETAYKENKFENIIKNVDQDKIFVFSDNIFKNLCDAVTSPGIIAYYSYLHRDFDRTSGKFLYLDDIREPGNLGGIIRSADALGLDGLIISPESCDLYNPKTVRSSMSSIFRLPIYFMSREDLVNLDFNILATSLDNSTSTRDYDFKDKDIVVIGNEAKGVSDFIMSHAKDFLNIPISDKVDSLNANVAASIIIYEMMK